MSRAAILMLALLSASAGQSQKGGLPAYNGPKPPKTDLPYLLHATKLIATEPGEAKESKRKDDTVYTLPGAASSVKTPVPEPIFILAADKLLPDKISMWKMQPKGSQRELLVEGKPGRNATRPVRLTVTKLVDNIYKLEVSEPIEDGEYVLSPDGSNQVFAFTVY
jgi:hypothetical protein